jgi:hypothetical protein
MDELGFTVIPDVVGDEQCATLARRLDLLANGGAGSRMLLERSWCAELADQLRQHTTIAPLLPAAAVGIQCNYFDKSPTKNWLVSLHQDLSIPVQARVESTRCSGWSEKEGHLYVQPPETVLRQLVAIRVHVDACPAESGALRVVPGSHRAGRLSAAQAESLRARNGEVVIPVSQGSALVMRPLLLHASSKSVQETSRRVLHFVFGPPKLPDGLAWRRAI